jgi:hypothetical protein
MMEQEGPAIGGDRPGNVVFYVTAKDALDFAATVHAAWLGGSAATTETTS